MVNLSKITYNKNIYREWAMFRPIGAPRNSLKNLYINIYDGVL